MLLLKALIAWLAFLVVAVACGAARERWLLPRLGELRAHQVGTLIVCAVFFGLMIGFVSLTRPTPNQALLVGGLWTAMVVSFELLFFHYVGGKPWGALLADYNILRGRLWTVLLLTLLLGPWLALRLIVAARPAMIPGQP